MSRAQYIVLLTLAALVVLTVLAVLGVNVGYFKNVPPTSKLASWGLGGALAEIITLFSFVAKFIFTKQSVKPLLIIGPPKRPATLREFDITRIKWVDERCFVLYGRSKRKRIELVPFQTGRGFRVVLPDGFLENIGNEDALQLELMDSKGNRWHVERFLPRENVIPLSVSENLAKVIADYSNEEE